MRTWFPSTSGAPLVRDSACAPIWRTDCTTCGSAMMLPLCRRRARGAIAWRGNVPGLRPRGPGGNGAERDDLPETGDRRQETGNRPRATGIDHEHTDLPTCRLPAACCLSPVPGERGGPLL